MRVTVTYDLPDADGPRGGPVQVGWMLTEDKAGIVFGPPERMRSAEVNRRHGKSASRCPAIINLESRYFVVPCPFDIHIEFARDKDGKAALRNLAGDAGSVRRKKLGEHLHLTGEAEWRYPDRPTIQLSLPYIFLADEPVYMSQTGAFMHYRSDPIPGTTFGGRFPIDIWPRPLLWAFEWHEPTKPLQLRRGEPLFYCHFETTPADRPVQMVEAEKTPELLEYLDLIGGAVNYVNQTFSLFKAAEARRPTKLLVPKARG
ncbi:MAG: hypothetical protein AAF713_07145 [Pseudomonadota bacterium]